MKHLIIIGLMSIFGITCSTHPGGENAGNIFPPDYQPKSPEFIRSWEAIEGDDPLVREAVLLELAEKVDVGYDYQLLISGLLIDTNPFVNGTAVWALDRIGRGGVEMSPMYGDRIEKGGGDPEFEFDYVGISARFDELDDPDVRKRLSAMVYADFEMLAGKLVTDGVMNDLDDEDPRIRYWAVEILGHTGSWEFTEPLMGLLDDPDAAVRVNAVEALGDIGTNAADALNEITLMLAEDASPNIRALAARAIAKIDPAGKASVDALIESMGDVDEYVRWSSVIAIGELGDVAADAIPYLSDALVNEEHQVQEKAAEALGRIGPAALPALIGALESDYPPVPLLAAKGLAILGPDAAGAVPNLIEILGYNDIALKKLAINALGAIGPAAAPAAPELVYIIEDMIHNDEHFTNEEMKGHRGEIPSLVASAIYAIGNIGPDAGGEAVPLLKELLIGRRYDMKVPAAFTLGRLGPLSKDAVGTLIFLLIEDSAKIRYNVAIALGLIGPDASSALPRLREIASTDPNGVVRIAAEEAVKKIETP